MLIPARTVLVTLILTAAALAAPSPVPASSPPTPAAMGDTWMDIFFAKICEIYLEFGGASCEELLHPYYHILWGVYDLNVLATYDTPAEQAALLAKLDAIKGLLGEPGNTLGATVTEEILDWLAAVEAGLPVPPG